MIISTLSPKIRPAVTFFNFAIPFCTTNISLLLTLPTKAFLGTTFSSCFCLVPKLAVPYIPALIPLLALFVISISTGKFKLSSAFGAIKVILPVMALSGKTLEVIGTVLPIFKPATWLSFTLTFNFSLETSTISNICVGGIPANIVPGSINLLLMNPLIGAFTLVSPTLMLA